MSDQNFDTFFVGDGSAALAGLSSPNDFVSQLSQLFTNSPTNSLSSMSFEIENDLVNFGKVSSKALAKCPAKAIDKIFLATKRSAYSTFNYLSILAEQVGSVPVKEEDLIVTENDQYIIEYLKKNRISKVSVENVARLLAYQGMGINQVRFFDECACPICKVFNDKIFDIDYVMPLVISGEYLAHPGLASFSPIIYREFYEGPLKNIYDIDSVISHGIEFQNVPRELQHLVTMIFPCVIHGFDYNKEPDARFEGCDKWLSNEEITKVNFVNMAEYLKNIPDSDGIVVYREGNVLYVHNSYVGNMGPIEFVQEWAKSDVVEKVDIKKLKKCDSYFIKGKKVAKYQGFYYSLETGEKVQ